jgi:hypothetical protein
LQVFNRLLHRCSHCIYDLTEIYFRNISLNYHITSLIISYLPYHILIYLTRRSSCTIFCTPPANAMSNAVSPLLSLIVLSAPVDTKARIALAQNSTWNKVISHVIWLHNTLESRYYGLDDWP